MPFLQRSKLRLAGPLRLYIGYCFSPKWPREKDSAGVQARVLNEEPFGPVAPLLRINDLDSVIAQANSLEYGLAAFAFTWPLTTATELGNRLQVGMVSINHFGLALPETPFGGVKANGHGSEGGLKVWMPI